MSQEILLRILYAALILAATWLAARRVVGAISFVLDRSALNKMLVQPLLRLARPLVWLLGIVATLNVLALQSLSNTLTALLGAAVLSIGLGVKGYMSDAAAGALLLSVRPFAVGDRVVLASSAGVIEEVGIIFTRVLSDDGNTLYLPNTLIASACIENITRINTRRVQIRMEVPWEVDPTAMQTQIRSFLREDPRVMSAPAPTVGIGKLGLDRVELVLNAWTTNEDHGPVDLELREKLVALRMERCSDKTSN